MNFPLGFFRGVSVSADLDTLEERCPEILRQAGVGPGAAAPAVLCRAARGPARRGGDPAHL